MNEIVILKAVAEIELNLDLSLNSCHTRVQPLCDQGDITTSYGIYCDLPKAVRLYSIQLFDLCIVSSSSLL